MGLSNQILTLWLGTVITGCALRVKKYRWPPELVQYFRLLGEFTSAQWRCVSLIVKVCLKSLAYPSGEEGGKFLVQMISTCLRYT
jgi:hypothetical protein